MPSARSFLRAIRGLIAAVSKLADTLWRNYLGEAAWRPYQCSQGLLLQFLSAIA